MKRDFSIQFLRVLPPDANFGEAWESLCFILLQAEAPKDELIRLGPPDRGIDILHRSDRCATQCKSHESGAAGTLPAEDSIESLCKACDHRSEFQWTTYSLATNARYSGVGFEKILKASADLGLVGDHLLYRGPEYWDALCEKHSQLVRNRFYYRITADEQHVLDAFRAAGYYDRFVADFAEKIHRAKFRLVITNNRTPVQISIPFSPELTVENYLDVAKALLGVSLDWTTFGDLNTSAGPSLAVTIGRQAQPFSKKIAELPIQPGDKLELWITIVWEDGKRKDAEDSTQTWERRFMTLPMRPSVRPDRPKGETTISRKQAIIEEMLWAGARQLVVRGAQVA